MCSTKGYNKLTISELFINSYNEVQARYPYTKFWLIRSYGRRQAWIAGFNSGATFRPIKKKLTNNYYIFFDASSNTKDIQEIVDFFVALIPE